MNAAVNLPTLDLELPGAIYIGPTMDEIVFAEAIPHDLSTVLIDANGFITFNGAFHVRGITAMPLWHSLGFAWNGERALHRLFPAVLPDDVPFAQDALGDQFLLRGDHIWKLHAETGELESLQLDIQDFLKALIQTPETLLPTEIMQRFHDEGGILLPGQLLNAYPPLCTKESELGVSLRAISALERIDFLAHFAAQIAAYPDGSRVQIHVVNDGAA